MSTSLFYKVLRRYVKFCSRFYFKKIEVHGIENIPVEGPVIFAANHQNAFLDAILIHIAQARAPFFLTRGDVFSKSAPNKILRSLNMRPIFRFRDGVSNIKKNKDTFSECYKILETNRALGIFPEGNHNPRFRLRPLQKGCARIVYDTEKRNQFRLRIKTVPVGIQYYGNQHSRSDVLIQFGPPISSHEFEALQEDEKAYHQAFTQELSEAMEKLILHLPEDQYDEVFDRWTNVRSNTWPLLDRFNDDLDIIEGRKGYVESPKQLRIITILQWPFILWGAINHAISYPLYLWILKTLVKDLDFMGSIKFGLAMIYFPIVYVLQTWLLSGILGNFTGIYFLLLPITGIMLKDWLRPRRNKIDARS